MKRAVAAALVVLVAAWLGWALKYPSDHKPEGAYLRIVKAVNLGRPGDAFAYLETAAQHAAYSIRDYRKKGRDLVLSAYPEPERSRIAKQYETEAAAPDGSDVFALLAERRGFVTLLRRDLSGVGKVEIDGERAVVQTARGTRYAFRRRENGIWGLTLFTPALAAEAERAARDFTLIEQAAKDYSRAAAAASTVPAPPP